MKSLQMRIMAKALPFLLLAPAVAPAQTAPTRAEAVAALHAANAPVAVRYTRQQIDQMVAPIALYPDQLLSQLLMAATYPDQVAQAADWLQDPEHAALKGDALVAALEPLPWDPSVKALVAFPQIVVMLSQHIEWTQALGVAFAMQQPEVMSRVQALRHLALHSGHLRKVRHLVVREEGPTIVIVSEEPDRVFVPIYNPAVVYGEWPDPRYQPVFLPPPPDFVAETIEPGLEVSAGYGIVAPLWGWSRPDWRRERIVVDRAEVRHIAPNAQFVGETWRHLGPVAPAVPPVRSKPATAAAAAVPAGTVAPAAAAAVAALPQRAAVPPSQIQTRQSPAATNTALQPAGGPKNEATRGGRPTAAGTPAAEPGKVGQAPASVAARHPPGTTPQPVPANGTGAATAAGRNTTGAMPNTMAPVEHHAARAAQQPDQQPTHYAPGTSRHGEGAASLPPTGQPQSAMPPQGLGHERPPGPPGPVPGASQPPHMPEHFGSIQPPHQTMPQGHAMPQGPAMAPQIQPAPMPQQAQHPTPMPPQVQHVAPQPPHPQPPAEPGHGSSMPPQAPHPAPAQAAQPPHPQGGQPPGQHGDEKHEH